MVSTLSAHFVLNLPEYIVNTIMVMLLFDKKKRMYARSTHSELFAEEHTFGTFGTKFCLNSYIYLTRDMLYQGYDSYGKKYYATKLLTPYTTFTA